MSISNFVSELPFISPALQMRESHQAFSLGEQLFLKHTRMSSDEAIVQGFFKQKRDTQFPTQRSCVSSLISGVAASIITKNPLPSLLGFSGCLPEAFAQLRLGNEFQVNTYTAENQQKSSVASLNYSNFIVTWESYLQDGSFHGVYGQLFAENATKIGNEFRVNSISNNWQHESTVTGLSNGNFVVTWTSKGQDGSGDGVFGQLFSGNANRIGSEFQVNTYTNGYQGDSTVKGLINGNFVVTWSSVNQDGSSYGVFGQLFSGSANKIGNEFQVNTYTDSGQWLSSAGSLADGNFVVTWASGGQDGWGDGIFGQLFSGDSGKIGNEFQINTNINNEQRYPSAAGLWNGNFVVTWSSQYQDGSNWGVYGQLFDGSANKIGNEFLVNTYTLNAQYTPVVTSLWDGNFVVIWTSVVTSQSGIFGQIFTENITTIGSEFRVNTDTLNSKLYPSVTSLGIDNFVVTWTGDKQDGSKFGIFGQVFNDIRITTSTITTSTFVISSAASSSTTSSNSNLTTPSTRISSAASSRSTTSSSILSTSSPRISSFSTTSAITSSTSNRTISASFTDPTRDSMIPSSLNNRSILWISVGIGGLFCFCVTTLGYLLLRKRKSPKETGFSDRLSASSTAFELEPVVQRHKDIGKYFQLSTLNRKEAKAIYLQTGHLITFSETQKKQKYVIESKPHRKIKVAQRIGDGQYVASKKVSGEESIPSEEHAAMQKAAAGDNVLPIFDSVRSEKAVYHFMPLAGLGDGSAIQQRLALLNQSPESLIILQFIAQNMLTGLQTIHAKGIYHLDMQPEKLVFTRDGTAYITDFGCAKKVKGSPHIEEALGDNRYFSPERLKACEKGTFNAKKADMWAAGVTLLQIFYNQDPLQLFDMPSSLSSRLEKCDDAHFEKTLLRFADVEKGSIWWVIKGLLDPNAKTRLTAKEALQAKCFEELDQTQQERAFRDLRKAPFAHYAKTEATQVDLRDYEWIMQAATQEETMQENHSANNQQFYNNALTPFTPEDYQLTPDHVTAPAPSSSGYLFTP